VKLIDFGLGQQNLNTFKTNDLYCGTLTFMAPEVAHKNKYAKSVDIWAIGIIMHIIITGGKHPILKSEDDLETYSERLKSLKKAVTPHQSLSNLAKNLF